MMVPDNCRKHDKKNKASEIKSEYQNVVIQHKCAELFQW